MLIKWEDLEPGDIIQYSDEVKERFVNAGCSWWSDRWCSQDLKILSIYKRSDHISIYFQNIKSKKTMVEYIDYNGLSTGSLREVITGSIFKIISLKES